MAEATFLITVHNGERYIASAVASALNQEDAEIRVVVVADGCTDDTVGVLTDLQRLDSRLCVIALPRIGRGAALNIGLDRVESPFTAVLDADDIAAPMRIRRQVDALTVLGDRYACTGSEVIIHHGSEEISFPDCLVGARIDPIDVTAEIRRRNPFGHSSVLLRTAAVRQVGGYSVNRLSQFDYDLFIRLAANGYRLAKQEEPLTAYRVHGMRYYGSGRQLKYRWGGLRTQVSALRSVPGPWTDALIVPARIMALPVSRKATSAIGRKIWIR